MREFDLIVEKLLVGKPLIGETRFETERCGDPVEVERAVAEHDGNPVSEPVSGAQLETFLGVADEVDHGRRVQPRPAQVDVAAGDAVDAGGRQRCGVDAEFARVDEADRDLLQIAADVFVDVVGVADVALFVGQAGAVSTSRFCASALT